uniref:Uncharacterized protein n=1 Tax=Anguilla anguilla TaxID=7936 RepID=A0A0E9PBQ9_ANGAN
MYNKLCTKQQTVPYLVLLFFRKYKQREDLPSYIQGQMLLILSNMCTC